MSTFWTWAKGEGFTDHHLLENIPTPKAAPPVIDPLTKEQVKALLKACNSTRPWKERPGTVTRRPTASHDKALLLFFLDTGCRVSEVCDLTIGDVDKSRQRVKVRGKGGKERFVYFGKRTGFALWQYLATRDDTDPDAPLFALSGGRPFTRDVMYRLFKRIGQRAGIDCYPHLFRHTFAITFLRNGGNLFVLQELLGHSSLKMVRRYARIAEVDAAAAHRLASPADNWNL